jgi:hypothetical protein
MIIIQEDEKQLDLEEKRIYPRMKCDLDAKYTTLTSQFPCKIVDYSQWGLGIALTLKNLPKGAVVNFIDPMTKAEVVWSKDDKAGLKLIYK